MNCKKGASLKHIAPVHRRCHANQFRNLPLPALAVQRKPPSALHGHRAAAFARHIPACLQPCESAVVFLHDACRPPPSAHPHRHNPHALRRQLHLHAPVTLIPHAYNPREIAYRQKLRRPLGEQCRIPVIDFRLKHLVHTLILHPHYLQRRGRHRKHPFPSLPFPQHLFLTQPNHHNQ